MPNKIHTIIDDAEVMETVNAEHTFRIGLLANTVKESMPVMVDDIVSLLSEDEVDIDKIRDSLPMLVHFNHGFPVAILIVVDKDSKDIQCYPFSSNNENGKWWSYDSAFIIEGKDLIQLRVVNSWVIHADPTQEAIDHMEALATMVRCFLSSVTSGKYELYDMEEDVATINKKRARNGKTQIVSTYGIREVQ